MSAVMAASTTAQELARNMSLFQIDEALAALVESAQDEAARNDGELSEQLRTALAGYVEAFGGESRSDHHYLKAQELFAELAKKEEERRKTVKPPFRALSSVTSRRFRPAHGNGSSTTVSDRRIRSGIRPVVAD